MAKKYLKAHFTSMKRSAPKLIIARLHIARNPYEKIFKIKITKIYTADLFKSLISASKYHIFCLCLLIVLVQNAENDYFFGKCVPFCMRFGTYIYRGKFKSSFAP